MFTESGQVILSVLTVIGLIFCTIIGLYMSVNAKSGIDRMLSVIVGCSSFLSLIFVSNII